jgi:hypothetical protein
MKTKNVTISLDENLLNAGRRYAKLKGTSINEMFREFLRGKVVADTGSDIAEEMMDALDAAQNQSKKRSWKREDAYQR